MPRPTARITAWLVLVLLGMPVAMHVVLHDLHDHHPSDAATLLEIGHGDHEHPIVGSAGTPTLRLVRTELPVAATDIPRSRMPLRLAGDDRNVVSPGALRIDDDVGLPLLLSTLLI